MITGKTHAAAGPLMGVVYGAAAGAVSTVAAALQVPDWAMILLTVAGFLLFLWLWWLRFRFALSYVDPGILFQAVVFLFTVIPLLTLIAFGYEFSGQGDTRLNSIVLDDGIVRDVWLCCNLVMTGFGASYLAFRKPISIKPIPEAEKADAFLWPALIISLGLFIAFISARGFGDYASEYLYVASLPVQVAQLLNIIISLLWISVFGILISTVRNRIYITAGLCFLLVVIFYLSSQARTNLALVAIAFVIAADHFRKRISVAVLVGSFVFGIVAFLFLGLLREGRLFGDALAQSEFMSVFVTAIDVRQLYVTGSTVDLNFNLLLADLVRLVPQQILPFEKVDPASWYVATFYPEYAAEGGGYAFGMVAESMLGGGATAAVLRGLALGGVVSVAFNYLSRRNSLWAHIIYMWLFANLYQCFRDTTFVLVGRFLVQVGPALLFLYLIAKLIMPVGNADRHARRFGRSSPSV
jgi:hypothetical protein